jgi:succinate dehydrogenase/fumarate reductase flavoprotein subunit
VSTKISRRDLLRTVGGAAAALATATRAEAAVTAWDSVADVVVVGAGAAGASAAIAARAAGAEVTILERAESGGGTSALAGGIIYYGGGTALQKALGYDDSVEAMFKYLMAASGPAPDETKVRVYCERSVEHYDWTVAQGVPFKASFYEGISLPLTDDGLLYSGSEKAWPFNEIAAPAPRGHKPRAVGDGGGALLMEKLLASCAKAGAKTVTSAICEALVRADDGRIVGVIAKLGSEEKRFRARRGVVLAGGGFCRNAEMMERYAPIYLACDSPIGVAGDDGRSIRMGMAAGADAVRMDSCFVAMPFHPPEKLIEGIVVGARGQRFINEDVYYGLMGNEIVRHQNGRATLILDASIDEDSDYARPVTIGKADTIEALESMMKLPEGALQTTMSLYNRFAASGDDPLYHKARRHVRPLNRPPYRALDIGTAAAYYPYFTLGGLRTKVGGEVLDVEGRIVAGLYAAGRTTLGVSALGYSSGVSLGDATLFGRFAGASAASAGRP